MNLARILVLVVALVAGGAAAYLAMTMINQEPEPATAPEIAVTEPTLPAMEIDEILVALQDIPLGNTLDANELIWREWPRSAIAGNYILRSEYPEAIEEITGAIARGTFFAGEPVTQGKLARTDGGLLSAMLPAGMRAVALMISTDTSAGGFILPNDRVDVIMTRQVEDFENGAPRYVTETILGNVRVLAIDQSIAEQNGEAVVIGSTATLELTPMQAEILTVAQQIADRLTLSLRSLADINAPVAADAVHLIEGDNRSVGVTIVRNGVPVQINPGQ